jgi:2-polyprenyl-6-methoxyphenol hydroxylase-like FAD-dependent oxidoreductase
MDGHACSRGLLEASIRRRLNRNPRIQFVEGYASCGLSADPGRSRVVGARVRQRRMPNESAGDEGTIEAELVVDATGRGSRAGDWLRDLGYGPVPTTEINAFLGYATRQYRLPPDPRRDWRGLYIQLAPPAQLRSGALLPIEGDRWIATLWGSGRDYPPTDEDGYLAFARGLRSPLLYETIKDAEPLTPIRPTRSTANVWHHYERLARWPDGFIALGDAVCAFNPVYGQGMSVGAMEALVLDQCLKERRGDGDLHGFALAFQKRLARTIEPVWLIATGEDARVPGVEGARPGPAAGLLYRYLDRITELSTEDPLARQALLDVLGLVKPTTSLFRPNLITLALLGPRRRAEGPVSPRGPVAMTTAS